MVGSPCSFYSILSERNVTTLVYHNKNDTIGICDELRIYPYTIETDEDYTMDIKVPKGTELEWSGYMIRIKETGGRIYLIYPMRKQDVKKRVGL